MIDAAIARNGIDAPEESISALRDGYDQQQIAEVDIEAANISSVPQPSPPPGRDG